MPLLLLVKSSVIYDRQYVRCLASVPWWVNIFLLITGWKYCYNKLLFLIILLLFFLFIILLLFNHVARMSCKYVDLIIKTVLFYLGYSSFVRQPWADHSLVSKCRNFDHSEKLAWSAYLCTQLLISEKHTVLLKYACRVNVSQLNS